MEKRQDFKDALLDHGREYLKSLAPLVLQTMRGLLSAKLELVRHNATSDILDRTGHKPLDKQEITPRNIDIILGEYDDED